MLFFRLLPRHILAFLLFGFLLLLLLLLPLLLLLFRALLLYVLLLLLTLLRRRLGIWPRSRWAFVGRRPVVRRTVRIGIVCIRRTVGVLGITIGPVGIRLIRVRLIRSRLIGIWRTIRILGIRCI